MQPSATKSPRWRRITFGTLIAVAITAILPFGWSENPRIHFNQHEIEAKWAAAGAFGAGETLERWWGNYRSGWRNLLGGTRMHLETEANFDDPASILRLVLAHAPSQPVVYPTELYYYYRFPLKGRVIGGNLRFVDADKGILHMGYFDVHDRSMINARSWSEADGISVSVDGDRVIVKTSDRSVTFRLTGSQLARAESVPIDNDEEIVCAVLDESGHALVLLFNNTVKAFYYILNDRIQSWEPLDPVPSAGDRYVVGRESRFVFRREKSPARLLLVGVSSRNIYENNYYDGPFDQVPPRLPIRDKLVAAYPYVTMRGGIDEHGNFIALEHQRVAISPYQNYDDLGRLVEQLDEADANASTDAERRLAWTYESKRDFHTRYDGKGAPVYVAQGWPANHHGDKSRLWGESHAWQVSSMWPPDHDTGPSLLLREPAEGSIRLPSNELPLRMISEDGSTPSEDEHGTSGSGMESGSSRND